MPILASLEITRNARLSNSLKLSGMSSCYPTQIANITTTITRQARHKSSRHTIQPPALHSTTTNTHTTTSLALLMQILTDHITTVKASATSSATPNSRNAPVPKHNSNSVKCMRILGRHRLGIGVLREGKRGGFLESLG